MDHVDASHTCDLMHDHRPRMPTRLRGLFIALGAAVEMKPVLHDVLRESQILVLVPETRNMIGANELATLPKDAIVINTGRGQVVDFLALSDALQNGHLFAAGIDAFYPEPLPSRHPLLTSTTVAVKICSLFCGDSFPWEDRMLVAGLSVTSLPWRSELAELKGRLACVFQRSETREQVGLYLDGLVGGVERKNGWQLAEHAGDEVPWRMQAVLGRGCWEADCARDICRDYVIERLGDPAGVLILDETGFVKKGTQSVGVARQYSGTAGRIENCQIGVFLGYASPKGHALIDRRLYLPQDWTEDAERCKKTYVPNDVVFATKPKIGTAMVKAALAAGVPCSWVLGDSVYGSDKGLRVMLEQHEKPYVLCVRGNEKLIIDGSFRSRTAENVAAVLAPQDWQRLPAGQGSKGPRLYDWARVRLLRLQAPPWDHWLLIRRSISDPTDMAFYVTFGPRTSELRDLAAVAGLRWTIEECFQSAKGETGLDHCEARSWHGWHRHMTLSMLAFAFLAGLRARLLETKTPTASGKANKRSLSAAA